MIILGPDWLIAFELGSCNLFSLPGTKGECSAKSKAAAVVFRQKAPVQPAYLATYLPTPHVQFFPSRFMNRSYHFASHYANLGLDNLKFLC